MVKAINSLDLESISRHACHIWMSGRAGRCGKVERDICVIMIDEKSLPDMGEKRISKLESEAGMLDSSGEAELAEYLTLGLSGQLANGGGDGVVFRWKRIWILSFFMMILSFASSSSSCMNSTERKLWYEEISADDMICRVDTHATTPDYAKRMQLPAPVLEKLDKILEKLDCVEKRLEVVEKRLSHTSGSVGLGKNVVWHGDRDICHGKLLHYLMGCTVWAASYYSTGSRGLMGNC